MKKLACLFLAALMLLSLAACGRHKEPEMVYVDEGPVEVEEQPAEDCIVLFSSGCAAEDMTVYARLAALAQETEWEYLAGNVSLVELGGFLRADETERYDALELMNRLGYEAAAIGEDDLALGVGTAQQAANAADGPFLCVDLMNAATEDPALDGWTLAWHGGRCIAYIGWLSAADGGALALTEGELSYRAEPDAELLQDAVDAARNAGADCVVLLSHVGKAAVQSVLSSLTGVDAAVDGAGADSAVLTDADGAAVDFLGVAPGAVGALILRAADGSAELCAQTLPEPEENMLNDLASLGYVGAAEEDAE